MDPNIDPTLQDIEEDPAMAFLDTLVSNNSTSTSSGGTDGDISDDEPPTTARAVYNGNPTLANNNLVNFGRMAKRQKRFSAESESDLDLFCSNPSAEERSAMLYAAVLETRDIVKQSQKIEQWQVSEGLKKSIRSYTQAHLLSPTTTSYRGNGPEHILKAMRELNVRDLPPEKEVTHVKAILAVIKTTLTSFRNVVKDKIKASLEPDSPTRNIADLTHAIVNNTPVKATAQHYIRIAFLRWHVLKYESLSDNEWWPRVDKTLDGWRSKLKDATEIAGAFNNMYQQDIQAYGDPANTSHTVIEPRDVVPWIKTVNTHAGNVQGKTVTKTVPRKRKAMEVE
ncbi:hypothetical protein FPV67DRAFT_1623661 [Lyophyllum atratum]|nr:hypothetical protein FPV67DRAFT_1623661 [Lyophyllum atratum]